MKRGTFIAVVGPSGAGKDTLIDAALARRPDLVRARRVVSRLASPLTEDFESVTRAEFDQRRAQGGLALHWEAHGLSYGISTSVEADLSAGRSVMANLSRAMVGAARARFAPVLVIVVTAAPDILDERLAARGRESAADIAARLARSQADMPTGPDVRHVDNGADLETGIAAFLAALPSQPAKT